MLLLNDNIMYICPRPRRVTVIVLSVSKIPANLWTLTLWKYYQQASTHTRIKSNNRLLLKLFCFKSYDNFCNSRSPFHNFQKTSGSKRVHWSATHLAWTLLLSNHSLQWSTIEVVAAATTSAGSKRQSISSSIHSSTWLKPQNSFLFYKSALRF